MKIVLIFLLFMTSFAPFAQKESNIWYFGYGAGLDFNGETPISITGSINTAEGCASIADNDGNSLFYTDGITVWNREHNPMPNGTGLMGSFSSTQSAIIVPKPSNPSLYYVFTIGAHEDPVGLHYSIVDMELNGGLGDITSVKNELLTYNVAEKLVAVQHKNNKDIWIISHLMENNTFQAHLLTADGLQPQTVESSCGTVLTGFGAGIGYMKASLNGYRLALAHSSLDKIELFNFNSLSGEVSNPIIIKDDFYYNSSYGLEFSASSRFLYISVNASLSSYIYQYDLHSNNIPGTKTLIAAAKQNVNLQLGPDNKIYIGGGSYIDGGTAIQYISVIHAPNLLGIACDFQEDYLMLDGNILSGLPPLIVKPSPIEAYEPPNIFTPNGDNKNDFFTLSIPNAATYSINIVNRWGDIVFESTDMLSPWDGTINDDNASDGTYFYVVSYSLHGSPEVNSVSGHLTLLR